MNRHGINPKWVVHTLGARGMPPISDQDADESIKAMTGKQAEAFRHLISRLHNGHDQAQDMEAAVTWIRQAKEDALAHQSSQASQINVAPSVETVTPQEGNPLTGNRAPVTGKDLVSDPDRLSTLHRERLARERLSHHVYGKDAALCVEPAVIDDSIPDMPTSIFHTLMLEMAPAKGDGRYEWVNKIAIRLTRRELPLFYAVCMGWANEVEFTNHGPQHDKFLAIKDQQTKLFVRMRQGKRALAVPVPPEELFYVAAMALTVLQKNLPGLDTQAVAMIARRAAAMRAAKPMEM